MDSSVHTTIVDLEIVKVIYVVGHSEIVTKTASTTDSWIRQRTQPLLTQK
jgi:hypothetical protein